MSLSLVLDHLQRLDPPPRVVSLDVFDTLIWRSVPPRVKARDATELLARRLPLTTRLTTVDDLVAARRRFARTRELEARRTGREWSIEAWFSWLATELGLPPDTLIPLGLSCELEADIATTYPAPTASSLLRELARDDLTVVATSDTQLPTHTLAALLDAHGLSFHRIYSSASTDHSKRAGLAFDFLAADLHVRTDQILHVGDNLKSDAVRPAAAGCRFLWLPRPSRPSLPATCRRRRRPSHHASEAFRALGARRETDSLAYDIGFNLLAPLLTTYAIWLARRSALDQLDQLLFIGRDGHTLMTVTDLLAPALDLPPRAHLNLSRRCVSLAHPDDLLGQLLGVPGRAARHTIADVLAPFAIPAPVKDAWLRRAGLTPDSRPSSANLQALKASLASLPLGDLRAQQAARLRAFVDQHIDQDATRLGLADVGWAGTIQDTLRAVLPAPIKLSGLYLGVSRDGHPPRPGSRKFGLLRDDHRPDPTRSIFAKTAGVIRLIETLLGPPTPPAMELIEDPRGRVTPRLGDPIERPPAENALLKALQHGLHDGAEARRPTVALLRELRADLPPRAWARVATAYLRRLAVHPTPREARLLLSLTYDDNSLHGPHRHTHLNLSSLRTGLTWYPGLLASMGFSTRRRQ